jgi:hypothetical protein
MLQHTLLLPSHMPIHFLAITLGFLVFTLSADADIFTMKDGSKVDGSVVREDATSFTLEVSITNSIKDERVVAKTDVLKIERGDPAQNAFAGIRKLIPVPDVQPPEEYAQRIHAAEKFILDHPASSYLKDARVILATLKDEANEVLAGGIKLNGKLIDSEEYTANQYEFDALVQKLKIRRLSSEQQDLEALRAFAEMEKNFRNTTAYNDLLPLMEQQITAYMEDIRASLASFEARVKKRDIGLERMSASDRRNTENAIRQENAELEALFQAETDAKIGWVTIHPFFKPSLEASLAFAKLELARLAVVKGQPVTDGGQVFRESLAVIKRHADSAQIAASLAAARNAKVSPRYMTLLETAARGGTTR